jgi:hypothetical protein
MSEEGEEGHQAANPSHEHTYGSNVPNVHVMTSSMNNAKPPPRGSEHYSELSHAHSTGSFEDSLRSSHAHLPKIQFPLFNGEDPQLWRSWCERYFDMYGVESSIWVKVAVMHLEGTVA